MKASELVAWLEERIELEGDHRVLVDYSFPEWLDVDDDDMPTGASHAGEPVILIPCGDAV